VSVLSTDGDIKLEVPHGAILDAVLENRRPDPVALQQLLGRAGLSAAEQTQAGHAMPPALMAKLYPHAEVMGQGAFTPTEALNLSGRNVILQASGGVGRASERLSLGDPSTWSAADKQTLSLAQADDVIEVRHAMVRWTGADATVNLADENIYKNPMLWAPVSASDTAPAGMEIVHSSVGLANLRQGQWVANDYVLTGLTLQVWDDLHLQATGTLAISSAGYAVVEAQGAVQISDGTGLGEAIVGLSASGRMRVQAEGGLSGLGSGSAAMLSSGSEMVLIASQGGIASHAQRSDASHGAMRISAGGTLSAKAQGDVHLFAITGDMRLGQVASTQGDVTLTTPLGSILNAGASPLNVVGDAVSLTAGSLAPSNNSNNLGTLAAALNLQAQSLQAQTLTYNRSVIAIENIGDLSVAAAQVGAEGTLLLRTSGALDLAGDVGVGRDRKSVV
jgi:hypothetical protein